MVALHQHGSSRLAALLPLHRPAVRPLDRQDMSFPHAQPTEFNWKGRRDVSLLALDSNVGAILSSAGKYLLNESTMFQPVVIGLSSGTFLYVGVVELLAKELADRSDYADRDDVPKFMLFVFGWGAMCVLALWT